MQRGHVSLVTPLMGSKVIFAAIGLIVLVGGGMTWMLWCAALLTTLGILLMGLTDMHSMPGKRLAGPVSMALISSALFASTDVLIMKWGPDFGRQAFLTVQMLTCGLLSLAVCVFSSLAAQADSDPRSALGGAWQLPGGCAEPVHGQRAWLFR